jgi:hypothetical protein
MIFFVVVCLVMVWVMYGVQDTFLPDGTSAGARWQSQAPIRVPLYSWSFTEDTELPSAPAKAVGPLFAPVPIPRPAGPGTEDVLKDGDAFFDAKFRNL